MDTRDQDWDLVKVVGGRRGLPPVGLENYGNFAQTSNALRERAVIRPKGVFRFRSFEEAQAWWETEWTIRPRDPRRSTT